jgi:hypothetical protein
MGKKRKSNYSSLILMAFIFPGGLTFIASTISYGIGFGILSGPIFWGLVWFIAFREK